jgi:hypothetical protein
MTELSPQAQAVLDAVASQMEGGWISPDFIPYEAKKIAAALRAVVQELKYFHELKYFGVNEKNILDIAAELEVSND